MAAPAAAILGCDGPRLTPDERRFFAEAQPWGFILFARNILSPDQVLRLTDGLRDAVGRDAPVLIDQEGGRVQRMGPPHWRQWLPPLDQVDRAGADAARAMYLRYRIIADELRAVGIDVTYLSKIENGRMTPPSAETIGKLAEELAGPDEAGLEDELMVLANRVPEDVGRIVTESPARPAFFRSVADFTDDELERLRQQADEIRRKRDA